MRNESCRFSGPIPKLTEDLFKKGFGIASVARRSIRALAVNPKVANIISASSEGSKYLIVLCSKSFARYWALPAIPLCTAACSRAVLQAASYWLPNCKQTETIKGVKTMNLGYHRGTF